jgi:RsiW-degrading membrane proteinase PrsW (M82 family)
MTEPGSVPDYTATGHGDLGAHPVSRAPDAVRSEAASVAQPGLAVTPRRRSPLFILLAVVGFILVALVLLFVVAYLLVGLGPTGVVVGAVLALVPLAIVFWGIRWVDLWEPEPRGALVFAFLWGAGASVLIALAVDAEIQNVIAAAGGPGPGYDFFSAAIQAPIVEEVGKGLGVLLLFWAVRRHFDGPVDGIVYSAWVAGGFAFTENILYFGQALLDGSTATTVETFVVRGIMSPFAHVMFSACLGAALGFAARRAGAWGVLGYFVLGLVPAVLLHAFWNGALFFVGDFYGYYLLVQVPLFLVAVWLVTLLRGQERRLTQARLNEYAEVGWLHPQEVAMIASTAGRRQAMAWSRRNGVSGLMAAFIRDATRLAYARQRILGDRDAIGARADEAALLAALSRSRHALREGRSS